ncbi:MAG: transposase, partial [Gammaproteobacteria bacterium]|nr:transposase [Gammaproteobacteria bacterium]
MKATRVLRSKNINKGKYARLEEQAGRLGRVRTETWQRFGSLSGVGLRDRTIRDQWLKEGRGFGVLANPWKETLRDAMGDIKACREAAKVKVRTAVWRHASDEAERKRLFTALKADKWMEDAYLRRMMRKHWGRGHNHTFNQIIVRSDSYTVFELGGRIWIKIPGLERGERIAIPLNAMVA